jgi:hypothetical protein
MDHADANVTHPALLAAIAAAEQAYETSEPTKMSDAQRYDFAWDSAFDAARATGLPSDDAKVVATSAASDGNADPEEGYKDIIPPYVRDFRMVVNRPDKRRNHAKRKEA